MQKIIKSIQKAGQLEEEICETTAVLFEKIAFLTSHDCPPPSNPAVVHPPTSTDSASVPAVSQSHISTTEEPSISPGIQPKD